MSQKQWLERLVYYEYLSELLESRRVLEIGCGSGQGADFVAHLARRVVAVDTSSIHLNEIRRAVSRPNLEFMAGEPDRLQLDSHIFDVILVPELLRWITRGSFIPELRRLLVPGGIAIFSVPCGDVAERRGMNYNDFYEYLAQGFTHVQLIGEIPFHGSIMAEFAPQEDLAPQLDSSLVEEDEPPVRYLAICSDQPLKSLGYGIIQIPGGASPANALEGLHEKFDRLVEERAEVEMNLEAMRAKLADAERRILQAGVESRHELTALRREAREKQEQIAAITKQLEETQAALEEAQSLQHEGERAVDEIVGDLRRELEEQRDLAQLELQQSRERLEQHVEASQRRIRQLEEDLRKAKTDKNADGHLVNELRQSRLRIQDLEQSLAKLQSSRQLEEAIAKTKIFSDELRRKGEKEEQAASAPALTSRIAELERRLEREIAWSNGLDKQLQKEQDRLDKERDRAEEAVKKYLEERGRMEALLIRAEAAERALQESRSAAEQQRQRAEGAEKRCDALVIRLEQGAGELSKLHQRMAELQGMHQADLWRIDELLGRLREQAAELASRASVETAKPEELKEAQQRIQELEQLANQLQQQGMELENAKSQLEQVAREAETGQAKAKIRVTELEAQISQHTEATTELERKLMLAESRGVEASRKATNAESKVVQLEVRLKRSESEAATLSKWAEQLREELKEAQGKSTIRPVTPEPEVAALRNDLKEAQTRVADLEARCDRFMKDAEQASAVLKEKESALQEAMRSSDGSLLEELKQLRSQVVELEANRQELQKCKRRLAEAERNLRDTEQAEAELKRTQRELRELREQVQDVDAAAEELEQLRLESIRYRDTKEELEHVRGELEMTRIELARVQDEMRGVTELAETEGWQEWHDQDEEEEEIEPEYEGYIGPELIEATSEREEEEEVIPQEIKEQLQTRDRQLEALLEGATLHRQECDRLQTQLVDFEELMQEMRIERDRLELQLNECNQRRMAQSVHEQKLETEVIRLGRELARAQGELKRCQDEYRKVSGDSSAADAHSSM